MTLHTQSILDSLTSHAESLGLFEKVNTHEPKNAPGRGLTVAIWCDQVGPVRSSGVNSTSGKLTFKLRIYSSMLAEPQDAIDPNAIDAVDQLFEAYHGDFELDGDARHIDLLGAYGPPMAMQAGYLMHGDKPFRILDITIPIVINDCWEQTA